MRYTVVEQRYYEEAVSVDKRKELRERGFSYNPDNKSWKRTIERGS